MLFRVRIQQQKQQCLRSFVYKTSEYDCVSLLIQKVVFAYIRLLLALLLTQCWVHVCFDFISS